MEKLIDINSYPVKKLLHIFLANKRPLEKKFRDIDKYSFMQKGVKLFNILFMDKQTILFWNTRDYIYLGKEFEKKCAITEELLLEKHGFELKPCICKTKEERRQHFIKNNEIMIPLAYLIHNTIEKEESGIGCLSAFIRIDEDGSWTATEEKVEFGNKSWKGYVKHPLFFPFCKDALTITTRYEQTTGEMINPPKRRPGYLDRKLRVVGENTTNEQAYITWAKKAVLSCTGYDYPGDTVLIARINLLMTFYEHYIERFGKEPEFITLEEIACIISKNIWQIKDFDD